MVEDLLHQTIITITADHLLVKGPAGQSVQNADRGEMNLVGLHGWIHTMTATTVVDRRPTKLIVVLLLYRAIKTVAAMIGVILRRHSIIAETIPKIIVDLLGMIVTDTLMIKRTIENDPHDDGVEVAAHLPLVGPVVARDPRLRPLAAVAAIPAEVPDVLDRKIMARSLLGTLFDGCGVSR